MKITKTQLRQIIREEILKEAGFFTKDDWPKNNKFPVGYYLTTKNVRLRGRNVKRGSLLRVTTSTGLEIYDIDQKAFDTFSSSWKYKDLDNEFWNEIAVDGKAKKLSPSQATQYVKKYK